jgi:transposase-like protein
MGVVLTALHRWGEQLRGERGGTTPTRIMTMSPEQKRIQGPSAQVRRLEREKEIQKNYRSLNVGLSRSVSLIEALDERYPRAELCRVFGVNRSSVYDAYTRRRRLDHRRITLLQLATELHLQSRGSVRARTLSAALRTQGVRWAVFWLGA